MNTVPNQLSNLIPIKSAKLFRMHIKPVKTFKSVCHKTSAETLL
jgi:hypothetical protein